jgi:hypothetical protein
MGKPDDYKSPKSTCDLKCNNKSSSDLEFNIYDYQIECSSKSKIIFYKYTPVKDMMNPPKEMKKEISGSLEKEMDECVVTCQKCLETRNKNWNNDLQTCADKCENKNNCTTKADDCQKEDKAKDESYKPVKQMTKKQIVEMIRSKIVGKLDKPVEQMTKKQIMEMIRSKIVGKLSKKLVAMVMELLNDMSEREIEGQFHMFMDTDLKNPSELKIISDIIESYYAEMVKREGIVLPTCVIFSDRCGSGQRKKDDTTQCSTRTCFASDCCEVTGSMEWYETKTFARRFRSSIEN